MEITAKWQHNPEYFEQYWKDWMMYRSKGRKHILAFSLVLIILGVVLYFGALPQLASSQRRGIIIIIIGILVAAWHFWDKRKWIKSMIQDSRPNNEIVMNFSQEGIKTKSDVSTGEATWEAIKELVPAKQGLFLILQKGMSIYLPRQSLAENNDISQIVQLFNNRTS